MLLPNSPTKAAPKLNKVATATKGAGKAALDYVDILRNNVNALGSAATESEKYELKVAELTKKYQEGTITADTYSRAVAAANPVMKELKDVAGQLGSSLVSAFVNGKSAGEALNTTLKSIASTAGSAAITKALSGDFGGAAVSAGISIVSFIGSKLFGNSAEDDKKQQEAQAAAAAAAKQAAEALQQAKEAFAGLARQVAEFNSLATGTAISDLTKSLADLEDRANSLMEAASKAQDDASVQQIGNTAVAGIVRLLTQFLRDAPDLIAEFGTGTTVMMDAKQAVRDLMSNFRSLDDAILEFGRRTGDTAGTLRATYSIIESVF